MQRVFTKATGRYERGQIADYPKATWDQIAASAKSSIDAFSAPVDKVLAQATNGQPQKSKVN